MKLKLLLVLLVVLAGGFVTLGLKETPVTQETVETPLKREQFLP